MPFDQRHVNLVKRAEVIDAIRCFFKGLGYLEVETPIRTREIIPEAHIDPVASGNWYLQASPELCMKRMLGSGCGPIFQICKVFRQEERGERHLPELTLLEWYTPDSTYLDIMNQIRDMVRYVAGKLQCKGKLPYQGQVIDLDADWERLTVQQAFKSIASRDVDETLEDGSYDEVMAFDIEPALGNRVPCFLYDYPASQASLARLKPGSRTIAQRMEFYIAGLELANGFTELTDPHEQMSRFKGEIQHRQQLGKPVAGMPEKFLNDLEHMPPASGVAFGIDRLVMLFCNASTIDDVVSFTPEML
ncbi:MAG: EF-P lysine aminoacylase GenX [Desulfobacteraceae bacterium]|nr:MAG: EF-P lysine aminoacylase GenX [Desulfobacteraceae bacterium]